jgi:hypothetical protein
MTDLDPLIVDFLEWLSAEPRYYANVMETWRTSCPRLTVWEDAVDRGLVTRTFQDGKGAIVALTETGQHFLDRQRSRPVVHTESRKTAARSLR